MSKSNLTGGNATGGKAKFSNNRDWRSFLSGAQTPSAYPSVAAALKAGHAWLTGRTWFGGPASCTYERLLGDAGLISGPRKTLGI